MVKGIVSQTIKPPKPVPVPRARIPEKSATGPRGRMPIPAGATSPVAPKPPNAAWWRSQYSADPSYLMLDPVLRAQQNQIGQSAGFRINRDQSGNTLYRTAGGVTGITQQTDDKGNIVYKDSAGTVYDPATLRMDIAEIKPGESGYLSGQLGLAAAQSANRQQDIGESAARAGVRRSGMRATTSLGEAEGLKNTISSILGTSMSGLSGIDRQYAQMVSDIYARLAPTAKGLADAARPQTGTPAPNPVNPSRVTKKPTRVRVGNNQAVFPKGFDLSKIDPDVVGSKITASIQKAGGFKKLKPNQVVGRFSAGGSRYVVVFVNKRLVVRAVG